MQIPASLYREIIRCMPIPCVDLMVENSGGQILLVKRCNTPARDQWWFPGGRVLYRETRRAAVGRKLMEECGLVPQTVEEVGTHSLLLDRDDGTGTAHSVTTVYRVRVDVTTGLRLDPQSCDAEWRVPAGWRKERLHRFVRDCLMRYGPERDA